MPLLSEITTRFTAQTADLEAGASRARSSVDQYTAATRAADAATAAIERAGRSAWSGIASALSTVGLAAQGLRALGQAAEGAANALGINFNAKIERMETAFTGLLGTLPKAQAYLQQLQTFAAKTPFEFPEVAAAAQRFMGMGLAAGRVLPLLTDIGNAIAKVGGGTQQVDRVSLAISQIAAKGKVSAQEMNQLAENGIAGWKILAESLHSSVAKVMKDAEDGKISAEQFLKAFHDANVGDAMARQSRTFSGAMSTIKDSVQIAVGNAFKPLFEIVRDGAVALADLVSSDRIQNWARDVGDRFAMLRGGIGGVVQVLQPTLAVFRLFAGALSDVARGGETLTGGLMRLPVLLRSIVAGFEQARQAVAGLFAAFQSGGIGGGFGQLTAMIPQVLTALTQARIHIIEILAGWGRAFVEWITPAAVQLVDGIMQAGQAAATWLAGPGIQLITSTMLRWAQGLVDWIAPAIPVVAGLLAGWAGGMFETLAANLPIFTQNMLNFAGALVDWILPMIPVAVAQLGTWGVAVFNWILDTGVPTLAGLVVQLGQQLVDWIGPRIPEIIGALGGVAGAILDWAGQMAQALWDHLGEWGKALVLWIAPRIEPARQALIGYGQQLMNWLGQVALPALGKIMELLGAQLVLWIANNAPKALGKLAEFGVQMISWAATEMLPALAKAMLDWGKAFITWVEDAIHNIPLRLQMFGKGVLTFIDNMRGPVGEFATAVGIALINGMIDGVNNNAGKLLTGVNMLFAQINQATGQDIFKPIQVQFQKIPQAATPQLNLLNAMVASKMGELPALAFPGMDALLKGTEQRMGQFDRSSRGVMEELGMRAAKGTQEMAAGAQPGLDKFLSDILAGFQTGAAGAKSELEKMRAAVNAEMGNMATQGGDQAGKLADNVGKHGKKAKEQAKIDYDALAKNVISALGQAAEGVQQKTKTVAETLTGLMDAIKPATEVGMKDVAGSINRWLQAAAKGAAPPAQELYATVTAQLQKLAQSANTHTAIMAQAALDHLEQLRVQATDKAEKLADKMDAAFLRAQQSAVNSLGKLASEAATPTGNLAEVIIGTMDLIESSGKAGMGRFAGDFQRLLGQMTSATPPPMAAIHANLVGTLERIAREGDTQLRLLARSVLANLAEAERVADEKTRKMADDTERNLLRMQRSVVSSLETVATNIGNGVDNLPELLLQLLSSADAATEAGMGAISATISRLITALRSGNVGAMQETLTTVRALLTQLAASTDLQTALMAQKALANLDRLVNETVAKSQEAQARAGEAAQKAQEQAQRALEQQQQQAARISQQAAQAGQSTIRALEQVAAATRDKGKDITDVLVALMPVLQNATDAGMQAVAGKIQGWLDAAAQGVPIPMQEIYQQITTWLQQAAASGDQALALLAQNALVHLNQISQGVQEQTQQTTGNLSQMGQASDDSSRKLAGLEAQLQRVKDAMAAADRAVEDAQRTVDGYQRQLDAAQQALQNFSHAQLAGTGANSEAQYANETAQARIRLQILDVQARGGGRSEIKALEDQLKDLQTAGERLRLEDRVNLDPLRHQLEQTANTAKELTFAEAMAGALAARQRIEELGPALAGATDQLGIAQAAQAAQRRVLDAATAAYDRQREALDRMTQQMDRTTQQAAQLGQGMTQGLAGQISAGETTTTTAIGNLTTNLLTTMRNTLGIDGTNGPSTATAGYGAGAVSGFVDQFSTDWNKFWEPKSPISLSLFEGDNAFWPKLVHNMDTRLSSWYSTNWDPRLKNLNTSMQNFFGEMAGDTAGATKPVGEEAGRGMIDGLASMQSQFEETARAMMRAAMSAAQQEAGSGGGATTGGSTTTNRAATVSAALAGGSRAPVTIGGGSSSSGSAGGGARANITINGGIHIDVQLPAHGDPTLPHYWYPVRDAISKALQGLALQNGTATS